MLSSYVPEGKSMKSSKASAESTLDIYGEDGGLVLGNVTLLEAYRMLPDGVYVINGKKSVKKSIFEL